MEITMTLSKVEHALGMMRIYLVERAARNDWTDERAEELAQTIVACVRHTTDDVRAGAPERTPRLSREALRCTVRFVNENLDSKLKWDDIAAVVGLDPFTFGRTFKLTTGVTPHQYIIRCRLRHAMRLLTRDELTLCDIALEVGCSCQSHLTTLFRKHLGTTPGAFRDAAKARAGMSGSRRVSAAVAANAGRDMATRGARSALQAFAQAH
jgi:transcriptional regulator GlxA family with amidase domain